MKFAVRMLRKHPVMTSAALLALTLGVPTSMVPNHVADALEAPIPEDSGDRVRSLRYWDRVANRPVSPTGFELTRWRELQSFARVGAFRVADYSVSDHFVESGTGAATPTSGAEITASGFEILGAVPLLGRTLDRADEGPGSPDVVLIGEDLWQARLGGARDVIGSTIQISGRAHTVVGVMPEGFLFPSRQQLWLPLRRELLVEPASGRPLRVFGRLAEGVTPEDAQAEVETDGDALAVEYPASNEHLRAEVVRFGTSELNLPRGGWTSLPDHRLLQGLAIVLLLIACTNVSMLVFARTATRYRELAVRTSLGASRRRIVAQMFAESLVLAVIAAGLGLVSLQWLAGWIRGMLATSDLGALPYWLDFGLTRDTVVRTLVAAVLSAGIASVLPALKVTGTRVQESIQRARAGSAGMRFGGISFSLIVADVAIAVAVVGLAIGTSGQLRDAWHAEDRVGIPAHEFLAVGLTVPSERAPRIGERASATQRGLSSQLALTQVTLVQRLEAEARVRAVAVADHLPREDHASRRIAVEGETSWLTVEGHPGAGVPPLLPVARVDPGFFGALEQPILAGRAFGPADLEEGVSTVIVNTRFVERRLGGRNAIGRRIRFWIGNDPSTARPEERWYEIVGVVGPLGMNVVVPEQDAGVYLPAAPGTIHPLRLAVHVDADPESFVPVLRQIVSEVDPTAVLEPPKSLDQVVQGMWYAYIATTICLALVLGILVALAASGIYAILSFAVSERTREIGIRTALGEGRAAIAFRVGRRSFAQIGLGALLGVPMAAHLFRLTELGYTEPGAATGFGVAFAGGLGVALAIGAIACVSPTRRALAIEPTEALKSES